MSTISFAQYPPSSQWVAVSLGLPDLKIWAFVKPPTFPQGIVFHIPAEMFSHPEAGRVLSVRRMIGAIGLDPAGCAQWYYLGQMLEGMGGANPLLDYPVPPAGEGLDPMIYVTFVGGGQGFSNAGQTLAGQTHAGQTLAGKTMPLQAEAGISGGVGQEELSPELIQTLFANMESDWRSIYHMEKTLAGTRKQLDGILGRLNGLNRDLRPEERLGASQLDQKEWQDARRRLRDLATNVARVMKEHDMGVTSGAGQKHRFEEIFNTYVVPRVPFPGMQQAFRELEMHRKLLSNLQNQITTVMQQCQSDGESRAQNILRRIQDAARNSRSKR